MAAVPLNPQPAVSAPPPPAPGEALPARTAIPVFIPREEAVLPYAPVTVEPPPREYSETERRSMIQLADLLGTNTSHPLAVVIPFPRLEGEDAALAQAQTVEEAMPLIGNMLKAEKIANGVKRPYPRIALKHQHIVAFMLCNPFATTTEICAFFSISPTTLRNIYRSDTFKSLVAAHKVTLESGIGEDLQAQLRDAMAAAVEVVQKAVVQGQDPDFALEVLDKTANRLGMGAKHQSAVAVQVNVVTPEMIAAARASRRSLPGAS